MDEIRGLMPLTGCDYDKENEAFTSWSPDKPMGVVTFVDNTNDFRENFSELDEVEVFSQMLSQQVAERYGEKRDFEGVVLVPYKTDGDIIFHLKEVTVGKLYGGHVLVAHYEYCSTVS